MAAILSRGDELTQCNLNKKAEILQHFKRHFYYKKMHILVQIPLKFVSKGPIGKKVSIGSASDYV